MDGEGGRVDAEEAQPRSDCAAVCGTDPGGAIPGESARDAKRPERHGFGNCEREAGNGETRAGGQRKRERSRAGTTGTGGERRSVGRYGAELRTQCVGQKFEHRPVMLGEVLAALQPKDGGQYVDGTLGGGGHAAAILATSSPSGWLFGCDRDGAAVEAAARRLAEFEGRFELRRGNFAEL